MNGSIIPMDLLGPFRFNLQTMVGNYGHYIASINSCGKPLYVNDTRMISCKINDTHDSSTAYLPLYNVGCFWQNHRGWELTASHGAGTCLSIEHKSMNRHRDLWAICFLLMMTSLIQILARNNMLHMICTQMSTWYGLWWPTHCGHRLSYTRCQKWLTSCKSIILMCL